MRNPYRVEFYRVPVGSEFSQNGNACVKRSTRTADILNLAAPRRFYWGRREVVTVSSDVRSAILRSEVQA